MKKAKKKITPSSKFNNTKQQQPVIKQPKEKPLITTSYYVDFDSFLKNSLNIVIVVGLDRKIKDINRVIKGYKKESVIGRPMFDFVPPSYIPTIKKVISNTFKTGKSQKYSTAGYDPKGEIVYYSSIATPIIENKKAKAIIIETADISAEVKIKEELQRSEEKFKKLADSSFEGIFIHQNGKIVLINKAVCKLLKCSEEEIIGKQVFQFIDSAFHEVVIKKIQEKDEAPYESKVIRKGSPSFWAEVSAREIEYNGGPARVVAIRDITKNKEYQEQIYKAQELYKKLIDSSPDGIIIHQNGKIVFANAVAMEVLEAKKNENLIGKNVFDYIVPEDVKKKKKRIKLIYENKLVPPVEINLKTLKGKVKKIEMRSSLIEYNGKQAIQGIFLDLSIQKQLLKEQIRVQLAEESNKLLQKEIDERKIAEEKMNKQSAKLNAIIESSAHIVWTIDKKGNLSSFNKNFQKYFEKNYGIKIKLGVSILAVDTISTKEHNKFWEEKISAAFTGKSQHFETKLVNKFGTISWLEMFLNQIVDDTGKTIEVSGIGHDITEKKESEELITQSLQEKEILLKEVHHRVKNNLQLVSSILNLQSSYVKDEKTLTVLKDSQNRIKSMSFIHESLYQTKNFSSINLSEYISELSKNLVHSYSNYEGDIKLKLDIQNVFLNLDLAIPCGLIINEILSNALKYAFNKISGNEELSVNMIVDGDYLTLLIGDNGIGLPKGIDFKNTDSLGLQIVTTLVEQLYGTIELDKTKKGTNYIVRFKHNQIKNRI